MRYVSGIIPLLALLSIAQPGSAQPYAPRQIERSELDLQKWFNEHIGTVRGSDFLHDYFAKRCTPSQSFIQERDERVLAALQLRFGSAASIVKRDFYTGTGFRHAAAPPSVIQEYLSRLDKGVQGFFAALDVSERYPLLTFSILTPRVEIAKSDSTQVYIVADRFQGDCFGGYEVSDGTNRYLTFTDVEKSSSSSVERSISWDFSDGAFSMNTGSSSIFLSLGEDVVSSYVGYLSEIVHVAFGDVMVRHAENDINSALNGKKDIDVEYVQASLAKWIQREEAVIHALTGSYVHKTTGYDAPLSNKPRYALLPSVDRIVSEKGARYVFDAWMHNPALIFPELSRNSR